MNIRASFWGNLSEVRAAALRQEDPMRMPNIGTCKVSYLFPHQQHLQSGECIDHDLSLCTYDNNRKLDQPTMFSSSSKSVEYSALPTSDDSHTVDNHLRVADQNLHRTRTSRSPSPRPQLALSTTTKTDDARHVSLLVDTPTVGSASKERFHRLPFGQPRGVTLRFRTALWNVYQKNIGLLLVASSTLTGSFMLLVVKLMTNQDATVSEDELKKPLIPPSEVRYASDFFIAFIISC